MSGVVCSLSIIEIISNFAFNEENIYCELKYDDILLHTKKAKPVGNKKKAVWMENFEFDVKTKNQKSHLKISLFALVKEIAHVEIVLDKEIKGMTSMWFIMTPSKNQNQKRLLKIKVNYELKEIGSNFNSDLKLIEYFIVSKLNENYVKTKSSKLTQERVSIKYKCPENNRPTLPLTSIRELNLFIFPTYFKFKNSWSAPIVFHFTLTINEQTVYGSSLIFYQKIQKKTKNLKIYEPSALTIMSRMAFYDQFSAILKYIYLSYFNSIYAANEFPWENNDSFNKTMEFLCDRLPFPENGKRLKIILKNPACKMFELENTRSLRFQIPCATGSELGLEGMGVDSSDSPQYTERPPSRPSIYKLIPRHLNLATNFTRRHSKNILDFFKFRRKSNNLQRSSSHPSLPSLHKNNTNISAKKQDKNKVDTEPFTFMRSLDIGNENINIIVEFEVEYNFYSLPLLSVDIYKNLFDILDIHTIVKIVACVLCEINTVFFSSQFSILTKVQECIKSLLFPFNWNHIYIPNLPKQLLHIVDAPVPYMIGVNSKYISKVKNSGLKNNSLFVDIDSSSISFESNIPTFPNNYKTALVEQLRRIFKPEIFEADSIFKHNHNMQSSELQKNIRKAFLHFYFKLLGDYRGYLYFENGKTPIFNTSKYITEVHNNSVFFIKFLQTHIFSVFMQSHLKHPSLLFDYNEYIYKNKSSLKREIITINIPKDIEKLMIYDYNFIKPDLKNYLEEKSNLESIKPLNMNEISLSLKIFIIKHQTVSNGQLASIAELLKLIKWREFFVNELTEWIKNPEKKILLYNSDKEIKKIKSLQNLSKIGLPSAAFYDLSFLIHVTLTECEFSSSSVDYKIAKDALDSSTIFYNKDTQHKQGSIENVDFIIKSLLSHKLLQNKHFWMSILINEINLKFNDEINDQDWCFQRIIRYAHQMVDLNSLKLDEVIECVRFWCSFCEMNNENLETLVKTVRNLEASKNMRISEYLNGNYTEFSNFEFIDKFGPLKKNLVPSTKLTEYSVSIKTDALRNTKYGNSKNKNDSKRRFSLKK